MRAVLVGIYQIDVEQITEMPAGESRYRKSVQVHSSEHAQLAVDFSMKTHKTPVVNGYHHDYIENAEHICCR